MKQLDTKTNDIIQNMSNLELVNGIDRLTRVIESQEWDKPMLSGMTKAVNKLKTELKTRKQKERVC